MSRLTIKITALILLLLLLFSAQAMTKEELRAEYKSITSALSDASPYAEKPDPQTFLTAGSLTEEAVQDALALVNFMRALAGLEDVGIDPLYSLRAQNASLVLAGNDALSHTPEKPAAMGEDMYRSGYIGASSGNIAKFNWMHSGILLDGIKYFARDDGQFNLSVLGHRRWLLDPKMEKTGFGLANAVNGNSFVVMHAVDGNNKDADWSYVAWPTADAFPTEFMQKDLAWSVSLNDEVYDLNASRPIITLAEETLGLAFTFDLSKETGDGYCRISYDNCGSGPCMIFRPNFAQTGFEAYEQNQIWHVRITGLAGTDGQAHEIEYTSRMVSLYPQDAANVEISRLEAEMKAGDTLSLSADVIPSYADDTRVFWSSSDAAVASIDENGLVTAHSAGNCTITVCSINGRTDHCEITVE